MSRAKPLIQALSGPPETAAQALLGSFASTSIGGQTVAVRLTELEAYGGRSDAASHAFGPRTERNAPMWGPPGTVYVYLSYGIHWCANIVTGREGQASAVLLRGGTVVDGLDTAIERRGRTEHLTDGPGKLAQALGLSGSDTGSNLTDGPLSIDPPFGSVTRIDATPRIGISKAADVLWRFVERNPTDRPSSTIP